MTKLEKNFNEIERVTHTGSWICDIRSDEIWWSDMMYELLGRRTDTIEPYLDWLLTRVYTDDRFCLIYHLTKAAKCNIDFSYIVRFRKNDDILIRVLLSGVCEKNNRGELTRILGTIKLCNEQMNVTERVVDTKRLRPILAHDLKAPIRRIASFVGLIKMNSWNELSPESRSYFGFVEDSTKELSNAVNDLLSLTKA